MRKDLQDLIGIEKGKIGLVLGLGPSLGRHLPYIKSVDNQKDKFKIISCNNIDRYTDVNFDYWMLAQPASDQSTFSIQNAYNRYVSRPKATLLYTDCLDLTPRPQVDRLLSSINYVGYDQRHFGGNPCTWGSGPGGRHTCCDHLVASRLCIQEVLQKVTGYPRHYSQGDTVGVHMLALAVILGMNPIYVTGIDLDYSKGYVNNDLPDTPDRIKMGMSSMNENPVMVQNVLDDLKMIADMAKKIGVEIYALDEDLKISGIFPVREFPDAEKIGWKGIQSHGRFERKNSETDIKIIDFSNLENNQAQKAKASLPDQEPNQEPHKNWQFNAPLIIGIPTLDLQDIPNNEKTDSSIFVPPIYKKFVLSDYDLKDVSAGNLNKKHDEYEWPMYTKEYKAQLNELLSEGLTFFLDDIYIGHQELVFVPANLHPNWKELYAAALLCNSEKIFEVGAGAGYHLKNIRKILPNAALVEGCDLLESQIEAAREFSGLTDKEIASIRHLDITNCFIEKQEDAGANGSELYEQKYDFVYSQAVLMHMNTENARAALKNMGRLSSKYIFLMEGIANHYNWYGMVKDCLPEFEMYHANMYTNNGILLVRKTKLAVKEPGNEMEMMEKNVEFKQMISEFINRAGITDKQDAVDNLLNDGLSDFIINGHHFLIDLVNQVLGPRGYYTFNDTSGALAKKDEQEYSEQNRDGKDYVMEQPANNTFTVESGPSNNVLNTVESTVKQTERIKEHEEVFVFTEIFGCAEVGKKAIESYFKYHTHKLHIFGTSEDFEELGDLPQAADVVYVGMPDSLAQLFKTGHQGTARLFAQLFCIESKIDNVIHFDSDVIFKQECLSDIRSKFAEGYDIVGTRRCYLNNPAGIAVTADTPDAVSTYFWGMKRSVIPKGYTLDQITDMFHGKNIDLPWAVFDFADAITFHAIRNGAKVYFLDPVDFGGQYPNGKKSNPFVPNYEPDANLHLDAGLKLVHFGGAGSGCVAYKDPFGKNEHYARWAVIRYALYCRLVLDKKILIADGPANYDKDGRWVSGLPDKNIIHLISLALNPLTNQ